MTVSSTCSPTPSLSAINRLQNDTMPNIMDNSQNTSEHLLNESKRFDGYSDGHTISSNAILSLKTSCNQIPANLSSINSMDQFQCIMNRRQRGEKRPIPDEQKDEKYFERRKRNNEAAKKSRDARKIREDRVCTNVLVLF